MDAADLRRRMAALPGGLLRHIDRVVDEAALLAEAHGIDAGRVALAAQGHDIARAIDPDELLRQAVAHGIDVTAIDRATPLLLHGPVGAAMLAHEHGIGDDAVLRAARYHTTAFAKMGPIERIVFIADKIEPQKRRGTPELERVRETALADLNAAMRELVDLHTIRAVEMGWALHPWLVAARNALLLDDPPSR